MVSQYRNGNLSYLKIPLDINLRIVPLKPVNNLITLKLFNLYIHSMTVLLACKFYFYLYQLWKADLYKIQTYVWVYDIYCLLLSIYYMLHLFWSHFRHTEYLFIDCKFIVAEGICDSSSYSEVTFITKKLPIWAESKYIRQGL